MPPGRVRHAVYVKGKMTKKIARQLIYDAAGSITSDTRSGLHPARPTRTPPTTPTGHRKNSGATTSHLQPIQRLGKTSTEDSLDDWITDGVQVNRCLISSIGNVPATEAEADDHANREDLKIAA